MKVALPIQAPGPEFIAGLLQAIEARGLVDGPAMGWDPQRGVFAVVRVARGLVVEWHLTNCTDAQRAERLRAAWQLSAEQVAAAFADEASGQ